MVSKKFWRGKRVFLTGHTGFKGSWMTMFLNFLNAEVYGYSLNPITNPSLFHEANLENKVYSKIGDIRDYVNLKKSIIDFNPDILIHMAAQPLVRKSYDIPVETFSTNLMGTVNVLDSSRYCNSLRSVIIITTDKCYENIEKKQGYVETDAMGGYDPYSSSKGCAELATSAYSRSFFKDHSTANIASVRAGNVIGGGDWSKDRLMPDILKSLENEKEIIIRNPNSIRPWQHVIEPLYGYLVLAQRIFDESKYTGSWNFGPNNSDCKKVEWIVNYMVDKWSHTPGWTKDSKQNPHESNLLMLDCSKAKKLLDWNPKWTIDLALDSIIDWQKSWIIGDNMYEKSMLNIKNYFNE